MKKRLLKILLSLTGIVILGLITLIGYLKIMLPDVGPAPDMKVEITPERVERGHYLAHHVMMCMDCHSQRNYSLFSAPLIPHTLGQGGEVFDQSMGLPGKFVAPNITPQNLAGWTDGEVFRAITSGVSKDGRTLFPIMPYPNYGQMDEEDIKSVIAYLRTLDPIEHDVEPSKPDFPVNIIINTIPKKAALRQIPPKSDLPAYGKYMITAASCADCHTLMGPDGPLGEPYAGGLEFHLPDGSVIRSANITPHPVTGIGSWTEEQFIARFKAYADSSFIAPKVGPDDFKTVMPWTLYGKMEKDDLRAIYAYLKTLNPVENPIIRFSPPGSPTRLATK
ncbi:c-type cytochrome [Gaoshiqia sp. Z1-71]|uniref:c-type cytochrome n=1 Tax=Gaoshiqia hydrogeniformans TaxID=3290090 RepID=UPI003BF88A68